jgi:hypothetical protein
MKVADEVVNQLVRKTKNASPAFIKELMRRSAQYHIQNGDGQHVAIEQVEAALDEMLFSGGSLNVKLLGGAVQIGSARAWVAPGDLGFTPIDFEQTAGVCPDRRATGLRGKWPCDSGSGGSWRGWTCVSPALGTGPVLGW